MSPAPAAGAPRSKTIVTGRGTEAAAHLGDTVLWEPCRGPASHAARYAQPVLIWAERAAVAAGVVVASACSGQSGLRYPTPAPLPPGASVVATSNASDDDDPLRGKIQVVDVGRASWRTVQEHYVAAYPQSSGWRVHKGDHERLCLLNTTNAHHDSVLDVAPYEGTRVASTPHRYLVMITHVERGQGNCNAAWQWAPVDLLPGPSN